MTHSKAMIFCLVTIAAAGCASKGGDPPQAARAAPRDAAGATFDDRSPPPAPVEPVEPVEPEPAAAAPPPVATLRAVEGAGYRGWIVDLPDDPAVISEHWTMTAADVAAIERALPAAIDAAQRRGELDGAPADLLARLPSYLRRYEPYKQPLVDVGLYCAAAAEHAAAPGTRVGDIKGGGDCYLTARYHTELGITSVRVNSRR